MKLHDLAVALIAVHAVVRIVISSRSYFHDDDFNYMTGAEQMPFFPFLFQNYTGHLMPGQFLLAWLAQHLAPMSWPVVVAMLVVLQSWAAVLVWRLLCELVGVSRGAVAGLVVFLFAPLSTSSWAWYASALQTVTFQLAAAGVLLHHVRYMRTRRPVDGWLAIGWYVVALLLWERGLVVVGLVALVSMLWFPAGRGLRGALATFRRDGRQWIAYGALSVAYLPIYFSITTQVSTEPVGIGVYVGTFWRALVHSVSPYLLGGPFRDARFSVDGVQKVGQGVWYFAVLCLVVVVTVARRRSAWRGWSLLVIYVMVISISIAATRGIFLGVLAGQSPRYFADVPMVAAIALAAALVPVIGANAVDRREDADPSDDAVVDGTSDVSRGSRLRWVPGAVLAVYVVASMVTSAVVVGNVPVDLLRSYVANARVDLSALGEVSVADEHIGPPIHYFGGVREVLVPMRLPVKFDEPTSQLYQVDGDGHLRPVVLSPAASGRIPTSEPCGQRVDNGSVVRIDLTNELIPWKWVIELDYFIGDDATISVDAAGEHHEVVLRSSEHQLFVSVAGGMDHLDVGLRGGSAPMCLIGVSVGTVATAR